MKKNFLIFVFFFVCYLATFGQVSLNTLKPMGIFHIDGRKDNPSIGTPIDSQQANDFVILQNGSIGIGTINPSQKLHLSSNTTSSTAIGTTSYNVISPTIRVDGFNASNNSAHSSSDGTNSVKPLMVNSLGEFVSAPSSAVVLNGCNGLDVIPSPLITVTCPDGGNSPVTTLSSSTFTLSQRSMVFFSFTVSFAMGKNTANATIADTMPRSIDLLLRFVSVPPSGANVPTVGSSFARTHVIYTAGNSAGSLPLSGVFANGNTYYRVLPAGTYTLELGAVLKTGTGTNSGYKVDFGHLSSDALDIVAYPVN